MLTWTVPPSGARLGQGKPGWGGGAHRAGREPWGAWAGEGSCVGLGGPGGWGGVRAVLQQMAGMCQMEGSRVFQWEVLWSGQMRAGKHQGVRAGPGQPPGL